MVRAWHGRGMASVNQTRSHCVNQIVKTHSKPLAVRHGRGTAWARRALCESAFRLLLDILLCFPRPTVSPLSITARHYLITELTESLQRAAYLWSSLM